MLRGRDIFTCVALGCKEGGDCIGGTHTFRKDPLQWGEGEGKKGKTDKVMFFKSKEISSIYHQIPFLH